MCFSYTHLRFFVLISISLRSASRFCLLRNEKLKKQIFFLGYLRTVESRLRFQVKLEGCKSAIKAVNLNFVFKFSFLYSFSFFALQKQDLYGLVVQL